MKGNQDLKKLLKAECVRILTERINAASEAMLSAQEAANNEGKSSAGDKYETSRAMGQQDRDMNARQLEQARKDLAYIQSIDIEKKMVQVGPGALVQTLDGMFFLAAGLGSVNISGEKIHIVSPAAPLANLLLEKKSGEHILLNGRRIEIQEVF